ncbi:proline-serine-threonine phosphatase interacting protein 1 [Microdochium nivale]|nr:proline-serine-threonine phosphatase interacting protein 1 [Microdochium nivale]
MPAASEAPTVALSFANNFWGKDDAGVAPMLERMAAAKQTNDELRSFYGARAAIEEDYARRLLALCRKSLGSQELGSLKHSLDTVRGEVECMGKQHALIAAQMKTELEEPLGAFAAGMKERRKIVQNTVEKLLKIKVQQTAVVNKTRDRYEQDCLKIKGYLAQGHMVMGQEERKNKAKLEKTQISVATTNTEYENAVKALEDTTGRWNREWKAAADKFQDLEEERLDFTKSSLWTFANVSSTVCVSDDASCEKIRISLENMDVEKDIINFITEKGTSQEIPDPPKYINFCRGDVDDHVSEASDDDAYSVAQFPRSINPAFRSSSPQPSTFESHHDPNSALAREMGLPEATPTTSSEATATPQRVESAQVMPLRDTRQGGHSVQPYGAGSEPRQITYDEQPVRRAAQPIQYIEGPSPSYNSRTDVRSQKSYNDVRAQQSYNDIRPQHSYDDARSQSYNDTRPHQSYNDARPQQTYSDGRLQQSFDDVRPQQTYTDGRLQQSLDDVRPQHSYDDARPQSYNDVRPQQSYNDARPQQPYNDVQPEQPYNDARPQHNYSDARPQRSYTDSQFAAVPHDPYPTDGMTMLCRTDGLNSATSSNLSARPLSRDDDNSDYSDPTSMSSIEPISTIASPVKQPEPSPAPEPEKRMLKKKSGFFQNHSPFRKKSIKDLQAVSNPNRNTWGPTTMSGTTEPLAVKTPVEPTTMRGPAEPPAAEPTVLRNSAESAALRNPAQSTAFKAPAQPATIKAPAQPTTIKAPAQSTATRTPIQPATFRSPVQPATFRSPVEPAAFKSPAEPAAFKSPVEPPAFRSPVEYTASRYSRSPVIRNAIEPAALKSSKSPVESTATKNSIELRRPQITAQRETRVERTASPDPIDANASLALNIGQNVFPVANSDRRNKPAETEPAATEDQDPIALALAELKSVTSGKQSAGRISADHYHGIATPAPDADRTRPFSRSVPTPKNDPALVAPKVTSPPSYDPPVQRLGVPPPAVTSKAMKEASRKYTEQKQTMFSRPQSTVYTASPTRSPTKHADVPRAVSPVPPRSVSPRPSIYSDTRQAARSASPNPYASGQQRPPSQMSQRPQAQPRASDQGYYRQNSTPDIRSASPAASHRGSWSSRPASRASRMGGSDMAIQLAPLGPDAYGSTAGSDYGGSVRGRGNGRPGTSSSNRGSMGPYDSRDPAQEGSRQRSKSVADPSRQYTPEGRPILHYARALYLYKPAIPEELGFAKGDTLAVLRHQDDGWWEAEIHSGAGQGRNGLVPSNYLQQC